MCQHNPDAGEYRFHLSVQFYCEIDGNLFHQVKVDERVADGT